MKKLVSTIFLITCLAACGGSGGGGGGATPPPPPPTPTPTPTVPEEVGNRPPVVSSLSLEADQSVPFVEKQLQGTDPDGDTLTYELQSPRSGNGYAQAYVNPQTGRLYVTIAQGFSGAFNLAYRATDGQLFSNSAEVSVSVAAISDDNDLGAQDIDPREYAGFEFSTLNGELNGVPGADATFPAMVDLSPNFPLPGDQGAQGSCVGWATAYALKTYQEKTELGWSLNTLDHLFSPAYVYNQVKLGGCGDGSFIHEALDLIVKQGVAPLSLMPYSDASCSALPSVAVQQEAQTYRALRRAKVSGTQAVKAALANRLPVVIGMSVYQDFELLRGPNSVYNTATGPNLGGHAITIVGYDDNRYGGAFHVINSWGRNWGDGGYFWLPYSFFPQVVSQAYILEDRDNNVPVGPVDTSEPPPSGDLPNLVVQDWDVAIDPRPRGAGELIFTIVNAGAATAPRGADINLMLSVDQTINSNDIYVVFESIPFDLAPGGSAFRDSTNAIRFTVPDTVAPGSYYLALWVDDLQEVVESNENDNVSLGSLLQFSNTLPDLVINSWFADWDRFGNGSLEYEILNNGASAVQTTTWDISLVLSPNEVIGDFDEILLFSESGAFALPPGATVYRDSLNPAGYSMLIDAFGNPVPLGTYFMALWVDDLQIETESNELNNTSLGSGVVTITSSGVLSASGKNDSALRTATPAENRVEASAMYNGKSLDRAGQILRKVRVSKAPDGGRTLEFIDELPSLSASRESLNVLTKTASSNDQLILPVTNKMPMPRWQQNDSDSQALSGNGEKH